MNRLYSIIFSFALMLVVAATARAATVTLKFADAKAQDAVEMVFNRTQFNTVFNTSRGDKFTSNTYQFEVNEGDKLNITLKLTDYDVVVNGNKVESTPLQVTVNEDVVYNIAATDRVYGTTTVTLWTNDINALELHEGMDGPVIDESKIQQLPTKEEYSFGSIQPSKRAEIQKYQITVSQKNPKVFIEAKEGYWIEASEYRDGADCTEAFAAFTGYELKVLCRKFEKNNKLIVFLATDGVNVLPEYVYLRDNHRNAFSLKEGYNEIPIDITYSTELTTSRPVTALYCNRSSIKFNEDNSVYTVGVDGDMLLHIFAEVSVPATCTVTAEFADGAKDDAKVVIDRYNVLTKDNPTVATFKGCEVSVTPGTNVYTLDGTTPAYTGATHTFAITGNHKIAIKEAAVNGIETVGTADRKTDSNAPAFSLQGQRVNANYRGIVVKNGRKVGVKD